MLELSIQKDTSVSLHEQITTQLSLQITSGLLKPGVRLPSIRALARKLGIHHNTCLSAYKELEERGLIVIRHGSGAQVAITDQDAPDTAPLPISSVDELAQLAEFFVHQVTRRGYTWEESLAALAQAHQQVGAQVRQPLMVVDIHADILPVFQVELQQMLQRPVQQSLLNALDTETVQNSHFVVSRYHYQALTARLKELGFSERQLTGQITMIDVGAVRQELDLIRQIPDNALVTVFSGSTIILQQAEAVIKALRGEEIYIRTVMPEEENEAEIQRLLKRSQVIFADWLCEPTLKKLTRKPIHTIRTIPPHELEKLKGFKANSGA